MADLLSDTELSDRGRKIITPTSILSPINPQLYIRLDDQVYNAEQLFQAIECRQLGLVDLLEEKLRNRYLYQPRLFNVETALSLTMKPTVPRWWVVKRNEVRRAIFEECCKQRLSFKTALNAIAHDTTFLFTTIHHRPDFVWTTGASERQLRREFSVIRQ